MDGLGKGNDTDDDVSSMKQPPPPPPPPPPPQQPQQEHSNNVLSMVCRLLPYAACFLVAFHFAQTTYRVLHDPRGLAFVLASYTMLALLFYCIRRFEALAAADSPDEIRTRERLKLSVWALSTALTAMFACRMPPMMPPPLNLIVWGLALVVTVGGFCLLFVSDAAGRGYSLENGNGASPSLDLLCRLLPYAACFPVAVHFAHTMYRVPHDPRDLAFVLAAYAVLSLLFYCIRRLEALSPAESQARERLKLSVWALLTPLTAMFTCHVSPMMPPPLNQIVWGLSFALVAYAMLALLFYCLRKFETLSADSRAEIREKLKLAMWALSTALTTMFSSCPVSPLNLLVRWVIAMLLAVGGFCSLLLSDGGEFGNSLEASLDPCHDSCSDRRHDCLLRRRRRRVRTGLRRVKFWVHRGPAIEGGRGGRGTAVGGGGGETAEAQPAAGRRRAVGGGGRRGSTGIG